MSKGRIVKSVIDMAAELAAKSKAPEVSRIDMGFKDVTKRIPALTEAARMLKSGQMRPEEYAELVNRLKPVSTYDFVPKPATAEEAVGALTSNKKDQFGKTADIRAGERADLRLDIPSYSQHGVWVNSIHRKDSPTVYGSTSAVKNAEMIPSADKALKVATGETPKAPFAVIRGEWNPLDEESAVKSAQKYLRHKDWRQVGYDPERHGYFYDRETMAPIVGADEVIQIGPLVLAKKPRYGSDKDFPFKNGGAVKMRDGGDAATYNEAMLRRNRKFSQTDLDQMRREVAENARRIAAEKQARLDNPPPAKMTEYNPTLQQKLGSATERGLKGLGATTPTARALSDVLTGGRMGSPLPLGMSVMDFTPAAIPVYGGQGVMNAADAAGKGNYGEAALELGLAGLDLAPGVPAAKALARAAKPMVKAGAKALAPKVGDLAEQYMTRTGLMKHLFIGEKSSTWNAGAAGKAVELEKAGVAPADIWRQTGTFRSPDGSLRQEISDVGSKFRGEKEMRELADSMKQQEVDIKGRIAESKLYPDLFPKQLTAAQKDMRRQAKDIKERRTMEGGPEYRVERGNRAEFALEHPELYKAYPNLSGMDVLQGGRSGSTKASYLEGIGGSDPGLVNVYDLGLRDNPRSSAVHEMQHAIQGIEDFGRGGNPEMAFQHKEAHEILNDLRKQALEPTPYEEYAKNAGLESLPLGDAMKIYEEYKKAIPKVAKQMDREFQTQAANLYYRRLAGEAEARAAQNRIDLTPEQRLENFPLGDNEGNVGYDVAPEDIIVKRRAKGGRVSMDAMRLAVGGMARGNLVRGGIDKVLDVGKAIEKAKQYTAVDRSRAGIEAAEMIKRQEQVRASEALGQLMEKGIKKVSTTQSDRTRVGGGNIGGANFPAISLVDPEYAGKVWGVGDKPTAARLTNLSSPETAWTTMLGSANQLKTNPIVFDRMRRKFLTEMRAGNLSAELEKKIDKNLELTFGEGASIRDPKIWKEADTFDKRSALADIMMGQGIPPSKGGVSLGGEKSGKGVIFKPSEILTKETEPSLLHSEHGGDVPTYALGPRLFSLGKETYYRPDLHPGFPQLIQGKDFGFNVKPTPSEVFLPDWYERFKEKFPERKAPPGYYDLSLGLKGEGLPSQELNDEYIRHLLREGFKKGGIVKRKKNGGVVRKAEGGQVRRMAEGGSIKASPSKPGQELLGRLGQTAERLGIKLEEAMKIVGQEGNSPIKSFLMNMVVSEPLKSAGTALQDYTGTPRDATKDYPYRRLLSGSGMTTSLDPRAVDVASFAAPVASRISNAIKHLPTDVMKAATAAYGPQATASHVIKPKGGNWLAGGVEDRLEQLKRFSAINFGGGRTNENEVNALNNWIDKQLTRYVKNDMGTPEDPIRALAEKGNIHFNPTAVNDPSPSNLMAKRVGAGMPAKGMGQSEAAKNWEDITDRSIKPASAGSYVHGSLDEDIVAQNPWLKKVDPEAEVYYATGLPRDVYFDHLVDELKNAINPRSGLPKELQLRPESLDRLSVQQAVERVAKINEWRAAQKAEADLVRANNPATVTFKEYPESYRWAELKTPDMPTGIPEGWSEPVMKGNSLRTVSPDGDVVLGADLPSLIKNIYTRHPETSGNPSRALEDALKYEGEQMGHCVGGYCPDVEEGRSRIYSLRDSKGQPHVTIEVEPNQSPYPVSEKSFSSLPYAKKAQYGEYVRQWRQRNPNIEDLTDEHVIQALKDAGVQPETDSIVQIKGKGNKKPADKYLPFVQDFVRGGQWSDVGDFQNTGLRDIEKTPVLKNWLNEKGVKDRYLTEQEYGQHEGDFLLNQLNPNDLGQSEGMKRGGRVKSAPSLDAMRLATLNKQRKRKYG